MRIEFRALEPYIFRWGGEFTWLATGPSVMGTSEPIPLPTTVIGALLTAMFGPYRGKEITLDTIANAVRNALGSEAIIRGPYIPGEDNIVALHLWSRRLIMLNYAEKKICLISPRYVDRVGIALSYTTKTVVLHMLYRASFIDLYELHKRYPALQASIAIDVINTSADKISSLNGKSIRLGGEGRVARIAISDKMRLVDLVKNILKDTDEEKCLAYVATPTLLTDKDVVDRLLKGEKVSLRIHREETVSIVIPTPAEVRDYLDLDRELDESFVKALRVKMSIISPGFDTLKKMPRPPYLCILPGSVLWVEPCREEVFMHGVGEYSVLGWGTLVPLPPKLKVVNVNPSN